MKKRAPLNRTINLTDSEFESLKNHFLRLNKPVRWEEINNRIIVGDLFSVIDFLPDNFIDLLFIDPPYNLYKNFNSVKFKELTQIQYEQWMESWLSKMIRMLKPTASVYICGDWKTSAAIFNIGTKYLKVKNRICWEREKGRGSKTNWKNCTEDIWYFTVSDNYIFNIDAVKIKRKVLAPYKSSDGKPKDWSEETQGKFRITHPSNLWTDITVPFWSMPENTDHPTQKPEKLLAKIILASSNEGDIIFDPFLGSGTTAVVAKKMNRNFCGVELDEKFAAISLKRLKIAETNNSIQGFQDGVFWERNSWSDKKKQSENLE
ncbi:MAG: site-specific DNA-methyltransferase [Ignavibacteriales bacterium]|nr:site-specific DNA-methyltransferase [Ignavibacteriales bacterium]